MAIQPKNTNDIKVDSIEEKTAAVGISLISTTKVDRIEERTAAAGVDFGHLTTHEAGAATDTVTERTATLGTTFSKNLHTGAAAYLTMKQQAGSGLTTFTPAATSRIHPNARRNVISTTVTGLLNIAMATHSHICGIAYFNGKPTGGNDIDDMKVVCFVANCDSGGNVTVRQNTISPAQVTNNLNFLITGSTNNIGFSSQYSSGSVSGTFDTRVYVDALYVEG